MAGLCARLGIEACFFSTPTMLLVRFGPPEAERTTLLRVEPVEGSDLGRLADLDRLADRVARGHIRVAEGIRRIEEIERRPPLYRPEVRIFCAGLLSGAAGCFFGAVVIEALMAAAAGALVAALAEGPFRWWARLAGVKAILSAFTVAALAAQLSPSVRPSLVALSGVILLVPGLAFTTALSELATQNLVSGTARLTGALLVFLQIVVGIGLASQVAPEVWSTASPAGPPLPPGSLAVAVAGASLSLQVLFEARPNHLPWVCLSAAVAVLGGRLGTAWLGPDFGGLVGAYGVGLVGNIGARLFLRPAVIGILPGLLLVVPGSLGVRSLASLLRDDTLAGLDAAFTVVVVGVTLVAGLLLANLTVSPRRST